MRRGCDGAYSVSAGRSGGLDALAFGDCPGRVCWQVVSARTGTTLATRVLICKVGQGDHGL